MGLALREAVALLLGRLDETPLSLVPPRTEALNLLVTYASAIADALPLATPECRGSRSATCMIS